MEHQDRNVIFTITTDMGINKIPYLVVFGAEANRNQEVRKYILPSVSRANQHRYVLKDQKAPLYFSLMLPGQPFDITVLREFHFEPGDRISIRILASGLPNLFNTIFSGRGVAKYICKNNFRQVMHCDSEVPVNTDDRHPHPYMPPVFPELLRKHINTYSAEMSAYSYHLLNADVVGAYGISVLEKIFRELLSLLKNNDFEGLKDQSSAFVANFNFDFIQDIPPHILCSSREYPQFLMIRIYCKCLITYQRLHPEEIIAEMHKINYLPLRQKMVSDYKKGFYRLHYQSAI